ncbi:MAG: hypothetical protein ABIY50_10550 [Ignavibacteria bacterium]
MNTIIFISIFLLSTNCFSQIDSDTGDLSVIDNNSLNNVVKITPSFDH